MFKVAGYAEVKPHHSKDNNQQISNQIIKKVAVESLKQLYHIFLKMSI